MNTGVSNWIKPELVVLVKSEQEREVGVDRIDAWVGPDVCRCDEISKSERSDL
jgi:hypothetical protein